MELLQRARAVRRSIAVDSAFRSYQAEARGYVYFFVDRPGSAEPVLIKADQVAIDLYWQAPNSTKQHIAGLRDEKLLPTNIRYHLDHLTVVQDDFSNSIRLGDGDEVAAVLHPVAPQSEASYDFLLADSLSLSYAGDEEEVRVYEIRVRPKDFDRPGFIGTVYLDRDRAAIVRMNFSFTPASYVDPYLDYIRISMDNSLWMGSYWLPYRQEVEIRREMPLLDFLSGSIIRGQFNIREYGFNIELESTFFLGQPITSASVIDRRAFPFERGILDDLKEQGGLAPSPTIAEVRTQVREVVEEEVLSGLAPVRLYLAGISDVARYNRAEGLFLGGGLTLRPTGDVLLRTTGGYSVGRDRASGALSMSGEGDGVVPALHAYWDAPGDIGGHAGATRLENTISSVSGSKDYLDPFFRRGATVTFATEPASALTLALRWEEQLSARDVVSDGPASDFRPVRSVHEGAVGALELSAHVRLPAQVSSTLNAAVGRLGERNFVSATLNSEWGFTHPDGVWSSRVTAAAGFTNAGAPAQNFFLLGGRYTLLGHDYRSFVGNAYWLVGAEATVPVLPPYLGLRAFAAGGASYLGDATLPADWSATDSEGVRATVGLGLSIGWDTVRIDVGRALGDGGWEALFSVAPQFRSWM